MGYVDDISLNRVTIVRALTAATLLLLAASVAGQVSKYMLGHDVALGLIRLFYLDNEGNIPAFFSTLLLLIASLLLALIATFKKTFQDTYHLHWIVLSFVLFSMAIDEACDIHGMFNNLGWWITGQRTGGIFHNGWVMFGMALPLIVAFSFLKFFLHLPNRAKIQFAASAVTFLSGAVGMEILGGLYSASQGVSASQGGVKDFQYSMFVTVEEGLEMAGVIIFINALLSYIHECQIEVRLRVAESPRNPRP